MKNLKIILMLIVVLSCGCAKKNETQVNKKLNVLFLIADDLNCDLGSYNHPQVISPSIDKLASNGVLFENAHNQYPLCGPSRASFMTGMYSDQTKITQNNVLLRTTVPDVVTIGQRFRQQGYRSVRIGKIYHYDNPSSIGTSSADDIYTWDYTINPWGRDKEEEYKINTLKERQYGGTLSWLAAEGTDEEQTDGIVATEAIEQLDKFSKSGQNFFLAVGMYRPHVPFVAPKKYYDMYDMDNMEILYNGSTEEYLSTLPDPAAKSIRWGNRNQGLLNLKSNNDLAKEIKEAYFATTTFMDAQIGRILKKLKQTGLDKNTVVVFTSDHGYHLSEHGHWQKQTLFENSTRIPLIFSVPGLKSGLRTNSPVEMIDIYPTLMELTGIETPDHVVGKSLTPILKNVDSSVRKSALTRWKNGYSIKTDRYRLTKWGEDGELGYELYDHQNDKEEMVNQSKNPNYLKVLDSLKLEIDLRIKGANAIPKGIGRQLEQESYKKAPNITPGDLYDKNGKRTYFKPADE